jgi:Domain of unknown function (DUF4149)/Domain of unknown function (DUF1772)
MVIALFFYLVALGCWLGAIVFFSFFTTPTIFGSLPKAEAGIVIRALFPRYYMLGYIAGTVSLILAIYFTAVRDSRVWWGTATVALALALGLTFYAGTVIRPRVNAIRSVTEESNRDPVRKAEFDSLHRMSVMMNAGALLMNLAALAASAGALTPRG